MMTNVNMSNDERGMGLLSILFVVVIIGFVYYFATSNNKKSPEVKPSYMSQTVTDAANSKNVIENTKFILDKAVEVRGDLAE